MTFGENLRVLRNSRNLSQKALAQELGFSFQNISKWERNESLPDIETLLAIAKFFGTTTDALLGYAPEEKFSCLQIDEKEVRVYKSYPESEEKVTGKIIFSIDSERKISAIVFMQYCRQYRTGYIREAYKPFDDNISTIIYENTYIPRGKREKVVDNKKVKIPKNGFVISVSNSTFAAKKIMQFIIPDEYHAYLDPDTHEGYHNSRNGKSLFHDILKRNELDNITVEITDRGLLFKKPAQTVDPMSVNIETLAKIVRKELQKEHNKQIDDLKASIDELTDMIDDNDSRIDDLEDQISKLMSQLGKEETDDE